MSWSSNDNFFVNAKLEVFSADLFSEPLELTQSKAVIYDGPKSDDFKRFLRSKNFRVNRQGKAIVCVQKRDDDGELLECQYDNFVLETVVPLGAFGFQNVPLPKPQAVNELQSLLNNTKSELAKKNDELLELKILLNDTKAELAKKNGALNELQSLADNTKAVFRRTMVAITNSMKKVFVDLGLEPLASEDPESVLRMLHNLILHKELGATFLVVANEILALIVGIFNKCTGLSIGMETNSPTTPARLIKGLFTLKGFMESRFFIDGSVIVRDFHLMNEEDLPIIFQDSTVDVAELKQKKIGTKSIDNIDGNSIFYGYFHIPMVVMFKGVLTRVHVNLSDGAGIFQKEEPLISPAGIKFAPSRVLSDQTNFLEFLLRMNRTFVNEKGTYLKFEFIASKPPILQGWFDNIVRYHDKDFVLLYPFKLVQFDKNECTIDIVQRDVAFLGTFTGKSEKYTTWIVNEALGNDCAFRLNEFVFIGKITKASNTFRNNALVNVFFEQSQHVQNCYVDALATTFFVLKTEKINSYNNDGKKALEFI